MKYRSITRKIRNYFHHDFVEIVWPSSIPDPPSSMENNVKISFSEHKKKWTKGLTEYFRTWRSQRNVGHRSTETNDDTNVHGQQGTIFQELATATRFGAEGVKPVFQRLYMARIEAYQNALSQFVQGYREGLDEVMKELTNERKPRDKEQN